MSVQRDVAEVLGVGIDRVDKEDLFGWVGAHIRSARAGAPPVTVAYANIHVVNAAQDDAELARFLRRVDLCYCDGAGVRLGARLLGESLPPRMTGADWIWDLAARAEGRWRIWWLGGAPGVTERAAAALLARHPRLEIGHDHGFHAKSGPENDAVIARIEAFDPDIVLVGMGTPIQERWAEAARPRLTAPVVWVLGATADFVSGEVSRGPELLYRNQEWLARLLVDPRRLWRRYLLGNSRFLLQVLAERAGLRSARR